MSRRFNPTIATRNWLFHRWDFIIKRIDRQGTKRWQVCVGSCVITEHASVSDAEAWIDGFMPESLADVAARHPELAPITMVIEGTPGRLARIPERLWPSYDAIDLGHTGSITVLSAKARALFPGDPAVFIRGRGKR